MQTLLLIVESQEPANFHKGVVNGFLKQKDIDLIILRCPRDVSYSHAVYDEQILHILKKQKKIDIFFAIQGEMIKKETVAELNRRGVKTVVWNVDDPYILTHAPNRVEHMRRTRKYQFVYTSNFESIGKHYAGMQKCVKFLPFGYDPVHHRDLKLKKEFDVSFVGSAFGTRLKKYINPLLGEIKLFGLTARSRVNHLEMIEIANKSKVNLNFSDQPANGVKCLKNRVPEIMGAGQFLLSEDFPEAKKLFTKDELVTFSSLEELKDKMKFYLKNDKERQKIAKAGYKKVKTEYSYEKLLRGVLEDIK